MKPDRKAENGKRKAEITSHHSPITIPHSPSTNHQSLITNHRALQRAFTLIELLVVMGIMAILMALVIPAIAPLLRSSNINQAAAMITGDLNSARQLALTQNRDVEFRFYQVGSGRTTNDKQYRAFRAFLTNPSDPTKPQPLSAVKYFPEPVIISGDSKISTLLDYTTYPVLDHKQETLPGVSAPVDYVSFRFRPSGGTNLTPVTGNWFLTIYLENAPKNAATTVPDNYFTAQIDAVTGRMRTYRP